jgi:hypothetical protein
MRWGSPLDQLKEEGTCGLNSNERSAHVQRRNGPGWKDGHAEPVVLMWEYSSIVHCVTEFAIPSQNRSLDCTKTPVFRGGGDLTPRYNLGEVKIKNGQVQPIRGVSLELDPADAAKHGVPHRVKSIPEELEIVQQGKRLGHHEIRPKIAMPVERFEELLKQVALEPTP